MPTTWKALLDTAVNKTEDWFSRLHSHEIVGPVSGGDDTFCRVRRWMKTGRGTSSSIPVYREGASNKVTFEQRLEGSDGVIYVGSGKVISQIETEAVMQVCVSGEKQPGAEGLEQSEPGERGKERSQMGEGQPRGHQETMPGNRGVKSDMDSYWKFWEVHLFQILKKKKKKKSSIRMKSGK